MANESNRDLASLLRLANLRPMTEEERKRQSISFTYGNMALMNRYHNATEEELDRLWALCCDAAGVDPKTFPRETKG